MASVPVDKQAAVADLAVRWRAARLAALRSSAPDANASASERELLGLALAHDVAATHKALFDNSLRLGRSFRSYHQQALALTDLPMLLSALGAPCTDGVFRSAETGPGLFLLRRACGMQELGAAACDAWHEALHGLVLGLTDGLFHTRHSSAARGAEACVDVFHPEGSELRYGAIPDDVRAGLEQISRLLRSFDSSLSLEFLGINDGALHYRLQQSASAQLSGRSQFERHLRKRFPHLSVHEVSPRPVMAG